MHTDNTTPGPRAIETLYNGYRFRSRIEARWAVFFDALGVKYEYEKEGFSLSGLRYLPDFWLPELDCWVEIKGHEIDFEHPDFEKCRRLAVASGKRVYLFYGQITPPLGDWKDPEDASAFVLYPLGDPAWVSTFHDEYRPVDDPNDPDRWWFASWWCECPVCGIAGIAFSGNAKHLWCHHSVDADTYDSPRLLAAYARARSARFEFGERGG